LINLRLLDLFDSVEPQSTLERTSIDERTSIGA
jgi:hypothetical protein